MENKQIVKTGNKEADAIVDEIVKLDAEIAGAYPHPDLFIITEKRRELKDKYFKIVCAGVVKDYSISKHKVMTGNPRLDSLAKEVIHLRDFLNVESHKILSEESISVLRSIIATKEKIYSVEAEKWDSEQGKRREYADTCAAIAASIRMVGLKDEHLSALKLLAGGSVRLAMGKLDACKGYVIMDEPGVDYGL
ncbi:hypothetical protein NIAMH_12 [Serratia phage vB_SmaS_Niamh]|nr:hypothetical protein SERRATIANATOR_56 [Serratia phage vB_SmaS_Serratianator]UGO52966.1 hypothetical protein NIAMH_12 [Serratia phage vB_SmaS_Niamh]